MEFGRVVFRSHQSVRDFEKHEGCTTPCRSAAWFILRVSRSPSHCGGCSAGRGSPRGYASAFAKKTANCGLTPGSSARARRSMSRKSFTATTPLLTESSLDCPRKNAKAGRWLCRQMSLANPQSTTLDAGDPEG